MTRRDFPPGYRPQNFCRGCGRDFSSVENFDRHRTGTYDYDYSIDRPDGRRCRDDDELLAIGLRPMTEDEMRASSRQKSRAGSGVPFWFDPSEVERARRTTARTAARDASSAREAHGAAS